MINHVMFEGRIVRQPEIKEIENEKKTKVTNFSLAHNRTKDEDPVFLNVVAYNKTAELAGSLKKSNSIIVEGRLKQNSWTDNQGNLRQSLELIANTIHFTGKKENSEEN